ncbi:MAG: acetyl-CoA carboxylase biotin carboxyl carrier protein subunit [Lewinellaceae bacterium]|nr:acetyl-CoA carboxylase biotin carboxyl carrier protein subunit [Lewinellaceae bacterium]
MTQEPFQLSVNGQHDFHLDPDLARALDIVPNGDQQFHVLHEGKAYKIELIESDYSNRHYTLLVNGQKHVVQIADFYDRLINALGLHAGGRQKLNVLKAPMPGLVLEVMVKPGQTVEKGDNLLILEAMKMENVLKAQGDGTLKAVHVEKGQAVTKGLLLLEFE